MSVIRETPYIEKVLATMSDSNLESLRTVLNSGGDNVNLSFATLTSSYQGKVTPVYFQFEDDGSVKTGILIWVAGKTTATLICYHRFQNLMLIELDTSAHTFKKINEYCDINELRRVLDDTIEAKGVIESGGAAANTVLAADGSGGTSWKEPLTVLKDANTPDGSAQYLLGLDSEGNVIKDELPEGIVVDQTIVADSANATSGKAVYDYFKAHGVEALKITNQGTTLGDIASQLNTINAAGEHVLFDVSALGASMYLCTIFIDTTNNVYRIFDMVVNRVSEGVYNSTTLLTMAIANADEIATQKQIDSLQTQIDELGGSKVIENWDQLGALIESGDSTDYINAGDTIDVNWVNTVLGTITGTGKTVSCTNKQTFTTKLGKAEAGNYLFVYDGTNWTYEGNTVDLSQWALSVSGTPVAGDVMTIVVTVKTVNYTFVGYDDITVNGDASHNWLLEQTYAPDTKAYDNIEALFTLAQGNTLPAGSYKVTVNQQGSANPSTLYFTVPTGGIAASDAKLQFAPTSTNWTSPYVPANVQAYKNGTNVTVGSAISLSTTEIAGATDLSTVTGITIHDSYYQVNFGNNNWERSNMRAWLNDASAGDGWTPTYEFDRPSGYNLGAGFLYCIDPRVLALIQTSQVKWTAGLDNDGYTQNTTYTAEDKVFLLSMKEMSFDINTAEGNATDLYSEYCGNVLTNDAVANRAKYNVAGGSKNSYRWSRSANTGVANSSRSVNSTGTYGNDIAIGSFYFAPAFAIGKASA